MRKSILYCALVMAISTGKIAWSLSGSDRTDIPKKNATADTKKSSRQLFSIVNQLDFSDLLADKDQLGPDDLKATQARLISSVGTEAENVSVLYLDRHAVVIQADVPAGFSPTVLCLIVNGKPPYVHLVPDRVLDSLLERVKSSTQIFPIINKLDFSDLVAGKNQLGPDDLQGLHAQLISSSGISASNVMVLHLESHAIILQADVPPEFSPSVLYLTANGIPLSIQVIPDDTVKPPAGKNKLSSQIFPIVNKLDFTELLDGNEQLGPDDLKNVHAQLISSTGASSEKGSVLHLENHAVVIQADVPPGFKPTVLYLTVNGKSPYVRIIPDQNPDPTADANKPSPHIFSIVNKLDFTELLGDKEELTPDDLKDAHAQLISSTGSSVENAPVLLLNKHAVAIQADVPRGFTPNVVKITVKGKPPLVRMIPGSDLESKNFELPMMADRSLLMLKDRTLKNWTVKGGGTCRYDAPKLEGVTGFAFNEKSESVPVQATFQSEATAIINFNASPSFKPKYVTLICNDQPATFFFQPPRPQLRQNMQFENPDVGKLCKATDALRNCPATDLTKLAVTFYPLPTTGEVTTATVTAISKGIAFIEFTGPEDYKPNLAKITSDSEGLSVLARSIPSWRSSPDMFNISYSVMDPETVRRSFGDRIAKRYYVVDLHLRNPGLRKIQIRKSAMWFDVDYARASDKVHNADHKRDPLYPNSLKPGEEKDNDLAVFATDYLHGIDQNMQQHPLSHSDVLNSYDEQGFLENKRFGFADLGTALFNGVSAAFGGQTIQTVGNMLSGTVLPKLRTLLMNDEREKRHRSNLVERTFQDVVQVNPKDSQETAVLLPRYVVLGNKDRRVISAIRDVHVDLEVVTDVLDENIAKGELKTGMTEAQVVQSLGVPDKRDENANAINYTYGHGLYKTVTFSHEGRTVSWDRRLTPEQGMLLADLEALVNPNPGSTFPSNFPSHKRLLWDGSEVWPNIGNPAQNLRIQNGVIAELNFHSAESEITALKGKSQEAVKQQLQDWAKTQGDSALKKVGDSLSKKTDKNGAVIYASPFASNESIRLSFDKNNNVTTAEIINN